MLGGTTVCRSALRKHAVEILHETSIPCVVLTRRRCMMDVLYTRCCGLDSIKRPSWRASFSVPRDQSL